MAPRNRRSSTSCELLPTRQARSSCYRKNASPPSTKTASQEEKLERDQHEERLEAHLCVRPKRLMSASVMKTKALRRSFHFRHLGELTNPFDRPLLDYLSLDCQLSSRNRPAAMKSSRISSTYWPNFDVCRTCRFRGRERSISMILCT